MWYNTALEVIPNVEEGLSYDITLDVAGNPHTLHSGIEINGEEFNCNLLQPDIVVLSFRLNISLSI
jgi:hypothetical protein